MSLVTSRIVEGTVEPSICSCRFGTPTLLADSGKDLSSSTLRLCIDCTSCLSDLPKPTEPRVDVSPPSSWRTSTEEDALRLSDSEPREEADAFRNRRFSDEPAARIVPTRSRRLLPRAGGFDMMVDT